MKPAAHFVFCWDAHSDSACVRSSSCLRGKGDGNERAAMHTTTAAVLVSRRPIQTAALWMGIGVWKGIKNRAAAVAAPINRSDWPGCDAWGH